MPKTRPQCMSIINTQMPKTRPQCMSIIILKCPKQGSCRSIMQLCAKCPNQGGLMHLIIINTQMPKSHNNYKCPKQGLMHVNYSTTYKYPSHTQMLNAQSKAIISTTYKYPSHTQMPKARPHACQLCISYL